MYVMNAARNIKKKRIFTAAAFTRDFGIDLKDGKRRFDENDVQKWMKIANKHSIPPYTMLKLWSMHNLGWKKKAMNQFVRRTDMGKRSFWTFCKKIYESDFTSAAYEAVIAKKSQAFEDMVYRKVECLLQ